jgi:hypothetical protein
MAGGAQSVTVLERHDDAHAAAQKPDESVKPRQGARLSVTWQTDSTSEALASAE